MWGEAFRKRRCLIPASGYYEWSGAKGHKRTHLFTDPDGGYLYIAGIWEENAEFGRRYPMITTEANSFVEAIHTRMPAVLEEREPALFLSGAMEVFSPAPAILHVSDAANPLTGKPQQGELF